MSRLVMAVAKFSALLIAAGEMDPSIFQNLISEKKLYVAIDGGPWAVCELLKSRENLSYKKIIDRCAVMRVENV